MSIIQWLIETLGWGKEETIERKGELCFRDQSTELLRKPAPESELRKDKNDGPSPKYVNVVINGETVKREMTSRGQYKSLPGDPRDKSTELLRNPAPEGELIKDKNEGLPPKYVNVIINGETVKREMTSRGQYKSLPGDPVKKDDYFTTYYRSKVARLSRKKSRFINAEIKHEVFRKHGGMCAKCFNTKDLEYDHIHPFSRGGDNVTSNIQLLCRKCNRSKGARTR